MHALFTVGIGTTLTTMLLWSLKHRASVAAGRSGDIGDRLVAAELRGAQAMSTVYCVIAWTAFAITARFF